MGDIMNNKVEIESQILDYIINEEISKVFGIKNDTVNKSGEQSE